MRLWSLHPAALDRQGLIASWREALLAQAVLLGRTRGYTRHPQLHRFREHPEPMQAIVAFLHGVREEAVVRGYRFDAGRIAELPESAGAGTDPSPIEVTTGQLDLEWQHLRAKIAARSPERLEAVDALVAGPAGAAREHPPAHPLFTVVPGGPADWERA